MNKFTILFLTLFLALPIAMKADSAKEKKDDSRYLVGAVPEVDGKVIFSKEFQIPGMSQAQIYDTVMKWMTERLKENQNVDSRVVYADEDKGPIAGIGEEWIVFSSSALSLDRTLINYQITVTCKPGYCLVELEKIRFTYRETEKYKAEIKFGALQVGPIFRTLYFGEIPERLWFISSFKTILATVTALFFIFSSNSVV